MDDYVDAIANRNFIDPFPHMTWDDIYATVLDYRMAFWRFPNRRASWSRTFPVNKSSLGRLRQENPDVNYAGSVSVKKLGIWCWQQRVAKEEGTISQEHVYKLNSLQFDWDLSKDIF